MKRIANLSIFVMALAVALLAAPVASAASGPELISVSSSEEPLDAVNHLPSVSDDGKRVAFVRTFHDESYIYVRDRSTGRTKWLGGEWGRYPTSTKIALSGDGSTLAVSSPRQLEVINVRSGISRSMPGKFTSISAPSISDSGAWVAFTGVRSSGGKQNAFRWGVTGNRVQTVSSSGGVSNAVISGNAKHVAYAYKGHVYRRTMANGERYIVDAGKMGEDSNADNAVPRAMSDGGLYILFTSSATNLSSNSSACGGKSTGCAYVRRIDDMGGAKIVSRSSTDQPVATSSLATMSDDASTVAYVTRSGLDSQPQAYVHRLTDGTTRQVSENGSGQPADAPVRGVSLDGSGKTAAFSTPASNLGSKAGDERVWATR